MGGSLQKRQPTGFKASPQVLLLVLFSLLKDVPDPRLVIPLSMETMETSQHRPASSPIAEVETVELTIHYRGQPLHLTFESHATISDLSKHIAEELAILPEKQKFLISPKPGLLKPPFANEEQASLPLSTIATRKITLLGSTNAEISSLNKTIQDSHAQVQRRYRGPIKAAKPAKMRDWKKVQDDSTYTFLQLRPLPYLPNPERSLKFLERLRDDPGIKTSMAKHKWSVPLLTEMNPAEHTTQESRTLGLNRNAGEVIELRLRTDAYDGYRDYKTIRKTLCHELAHNVFGEHDRNFWDLCHEIEREVDRADWKSGGHALTNQEFYDPGPQDEDFVADHGRWEGGDYVLGTGGGSSAVTSDAGGASLSRREIVAKAAEERMRKQQQQQKKPDEL